MGGARCPHLPPDDAEKVPELKDRDAWARFPIDRFDAVIIDSLVSSTEGMTEKEGRDTTNILATLLDLAAKDVAIVLIHHPTKDGASVRGRGEWMACVDLIYGNARCHRFHAIGERALVARIAPGGSRIGRIGRAGGPTARFSDGVYLE